MSEIRAILGGQLGFRLRLNILTLRMSVVQPAFSFVKFLVSIIEWFSTFLFWMLLNTQIMHAVNQICNILEFYTNSYSGLQNSPTQVESLNAFCKGAGKKNFEVMFGSK